MAVRTVLDVLQSASLFPRTFTLNARSRRVLDAPTRNGGWADVRDHQLCMNMTKMDT